LFFSIFFVTTKTVVSPPKPIFFFLLPPKIPFSLIIIRRAHPHAGFMDFMNHYRQLAFKATVDLAVLEGK